eukprot:1285830-Rhodomonas_salina.1
MNERQDLDITDSESEARSRGQEGRRTRMAGVVEEPDAVAVELAPTSDMILNLLASEHDNLDHVHALRSGG